MLFEILVRFSVSGSVAWIKQCVLLSLNIDQEERTVETCSVLRRMASRSASVGSSIQICAVVSYFWRRRGKRMKMKSTTKSLSTM